MIKVAKLSFIALFIVSAILALFPNKPISLLTYIGMMIFFGLLCYLGFLVVKGLWKSTERQKDEPTPEEQMKIELVKGLKRWSDALSGPDEYQEIVGEMMARAYVINKYYLRQELRPFPLTDPDKAMQHRGGD